MLDESRVDVQTGRAVAMGWCDVQGLARQADIDHPRPQCSAAPKRIGILIVDDIELIRALADHARENRAIALDLVELESTVLGQNNSAIERSASELHESHAPAGTASPSSSKSLWPTTLSGSVAAGGEPCLFP